MNLYIYVGNNPINAWDPLGLATVTNCETYKEGGGRGRCKEIEDLTRETFTSRRKAARAAAEKLRKITQKTGKEWGVVIERNEDGTYTVSVAVRNTDDDEVRALDDVIDRTDNPAGDFHTHPTPHEKGDERGGEFETVQSQADLDRADIYAGELGTDFRSYWVDGPTGDIYEYEGDSSGWEKDEEGNWSPKTTGERKFNLGKIGSTEPYRPKRKLR